MSFVNSSYPEINLIFATPKTINMTAKLTLFTLTIGSLVLTSSCGENKEHESVNPVDSTSAVVKDTTKVTVSDTTKFKFDFALANIPSPAASMQEMAKWNVAYNNSVLNDTKNASKYSTEFQRAINIGVYNIDMCYAMSHDKGEDVLKYMKTVMTLSDAMGLKGAVNAMVGKRAESNLGNRDSLFKILDEIFVKSDDYLRTNDRVFTAATVFTGGWLENLYIICETEMNGDEAVKSKVHNLLWEQRFHLGNIINLLNDYKDKKEAAQLIADLKPIHDEINAVKQSKDMDETRFKGIASKIVDLRGKLTK